VFMSNRITGMEKVGAKYICISTLYSVLVETVFGDIGLFSFYQWRLYG